MDIETANNEPIRQATLDDLAGVFAGNFGATVSLARNYGDRLEATACANGAFRLAFYDASSGRRQEAAVPLTFAQVKEAFADYFDGNWNWHGCHAWRTI